MIRSRAIWKRESDVRTVFLALAPAISCMCSAMPLATRPWASTFVAPQFDTSVGIVTKISVRITSSVLLTANVRAVLRSAPPN